MMFLLTTFIPLGISPLDLILLTLSSRCKELILATIRALFDLIDENTRQVCIYDFLYISPSHFLLPPRMLRKDKYHPF